MNDFIIPDKPQTWTPERDETLRSMWSNPSLSASEIAARMGLTKNQVLGRAHRLKLAARQPGLQKRIPSKPIPASVPRLIGKGKCKFPMWANDAEPDHHYCEAPAIEGGPYCPEHHDRCYIPVDPSKKAPKGGFDWLLKRVA